MSEFSQTAPGGAGDAAAGGTPSESDLPRMQGLGESTDDPSDPTAARRDADEPVNQTPEEFTGSEDESASDPMPDISGTSGG